MNWKSLYRFLVKCRNALDALIARVRVKAFPESNGMRRKRADQPVTPAA